MIKILCQLCRRRHVIAKKVNRLYCDECNQVKAAIVKQIFIDNKKATHEYPSIGCLSRRTD